MPQFARHLFLHPAHAAVGVLSGAAILESCTATAAFSQAPPARVCLVPWNSTAAGSEPLNTWIQSLARDDRVRCYQAMPSAVSGLPVLADLDQSDCWVLLGRPLGWNSGQWAQVEDGARRRPLVALLEACHALPHVEAFHREILGAQFDGHRANHGIEVTLPRSNRAHPLLTGVGPFLAEGGLEAVRQLAADATVLLYGTFAGRRVPVAWVRRGPGGDVFCTTLSGPANLARPSFQRLLSNALHAVCSQA